MSRSGGLIAASAVGLALASCAGGTPATKGLSESPGAVDVGPPALKVARVVDEGPGPASSRWRPGAIRRRTVAAAGLERVLMVRGRPRPAARTRRVPAKNPIGQRLAFLVVDRRDRSGRGWLRILLPERPNGSSGWVRARSVRPIAVRDHIEVDLSRRELRHYRDRKLRHRFSVAIGAASTPTPLGLYFVWARVPQPNPSGAYGSFALGLSGFSEHLIDWPGGGRLAVHGTADSHDGGRAVSHGCVRVYNQDMNRLRNVPMGTPVIIRL